MTDPIEPREAPSEEAGDTPGQSDSERSPIDNRFIPVRPEALAEDIGRDSARFPAVAPHGRALLDAITLVILQETSTFRRVLDGRYAPFNPDRDTLRAEEGEPTLDAAQTLCRSFRYVFEKANFERLEGASVEGALEMARRGGLRVKLKPERIEHLELFVRGRGETRRVEKTLRAPVKGAPVTLETFRRLGVVFRPAGSTDVVLKLFRDIPIIEVEALLPHAEVAMTWQDRAKVAFGSAGALGGIASKVVKGGALLSAPAALAVPMIIALGGLSVKSFVGYRRAKSSRVSQRTQHLYHQTLAGNAAVLHVLLAHVAAEETKEALLGYALLADAGEAAPGREVLRAAAESWLVERYSAVVAFDADDALETLDRLGLWSERGSWRVLAPEEAIARLADHAVRRATAGYHVERCDGASEAGAEAAQGESPAGGKARALSG